MTPADLMHITLKKEQQKWLQEQVAAGKFSSPDEAVHEALALLKEEVGSDLSWAKTHVDTALAELDHGKGIPAEKVFREVRAQITRR